MPAPGPMLLLHGVASSSTTWWRAREDLHDLGWEVLALDLPGHGTRPVPPGGLHRLADFTTDVLAQLDGRRIEVLVGHSLGALVALDLAARSPEQIGKVIIEDPPALGGSVTVVAVADGMEAELVRVAADPHGEEADLAASNPQWAARDVSAYVSNRQALAADVIPAFVRGAHWELPALIADCPRPVFLIAAAGPESMLVEPGRSRVLALLPKDHVALIAAGHGVHRDRPGLWLQAVLDFAAAV